MSKYSLGRQFLINLFCYMPDLRKKQYQVAPIPHLSSREGKKIWTATLQKIHCK